MEYHKTNWCGTFHQTSMCHNIVNLSFMYITEYDFQVQSNLGNTFSSMCDMYNFHLDQDAQQKGENGSAKHMNFKCFLQPNFLDPSRPKESCIYSTENLSPTTTSTKLFINFLTTLLHQARSPSLFICLLRTCARNLQEQFSRGVFKIVHDER